MLQHFFAAIEQHFAFFFQVMTGFIIEFYPEPIVDLSKLLEQNAI